MSRPTFDAKKAANQAENIYGVSMQLGEIRTVTVFDTAIQVHKFVEVLLVAKNNYRFFASTKDANRWRVIRGLPEVDPPITKTEKAIKLMHVPPTRGRVR